MTDLHHKVVLEQAILRLFRAIDDGETQLVSAMFKADGIWHRRDGKYSGRIAIEDAMRRRPPGRRVQHLVSNFIVISDRERRAKVGFKTLAFVDDHPLVGTPSPMSMPIALDVYCATLVELKGVWLTTHLKGDRLFGAQGKRAPYETALAS